MALQAFKEELDMMSLRPIQWVRQTNSESFKQNFIKSEYYTPMYRYVGWNMRRPYFKDRRSRQALTQLINRESIVNNLNLGSHGW